ncbi:hypothetical protein LNV23_05775 [Paucibacter sp. DJ1R-11]|uniref:hypothetical protein n=1 Tax=Paucibacter sp. DJ1R-11 TaxID=2893556 RepID=UPI0021E4D4E5|nr:hypothetical protein [Paucibacter sp. DJ1R-11]MCV2362960.1 hypothetical protein [Paucibacter sp. DJ1R-11]
MHSQSQSRPAPNRQSPMPPDAPDCSAGHGCGWFDSSYELRQGLVVTEDTDTCLLQLWAQALQMSRVCH